MKKVILIFALCFLCTSCDPPYNNNPGQWYVKNGTEQTLTLEYNLLREPKIITPGESVLLGMWYFDDSPIIFDSYFKEMAYAYGTQYVKIFSEDNTLLRTWTYEERDLPGKQYFNGSSWVYYRTDAAGNNSLVKVIWTFEILPEDIPSE